MITPDSAVTEHLPPALPAPALPRLADLLTPGRLVEVVDAGASPLVGEPPPYRPLVDAGLARVTGFEPDEEALAALTATGSPLDRHLGVALGDGAPHELRLCSASGFSSLFEPDPDQLAVLTDFPRLAEVVDRVTVPTSRLDDLGEVERADLLALDVQGAEAMVLDGAARVLATAFAVQVEVGFHRIYSGAPTFADIDVRLREAGFVPHAFVTSRTWPIDPVPWHDPLQAHARHLVEADVLYVRDLTTWPALDTDVLACGALLSCGAYGSLGLGLRAVRELRARGAVPDDAEERFRDAVVAPTISSHPVGKEG